MLEVEIQKLTAAIQALTETIEKLNRGNLLSSIAETDAAITPVEIPTNSDKPKRGRPKKEEVVVEQVEEAAEKSPEKLPEPTVIPPNISFAQFTQDDLKNLAMEISRADSSTRPLIMDILGKRGSKTITHLDPKFYREVHADLMALAYEIAKNGEPV